MWKAGYEDGVFKDDHGSLHQYFFLINIFDYLYTVYTLYIHCIYTYTLYVATTMINDEDFDYMGLVMKSIQEKTKQNRTMPGKLKRNHWTNKRTEGE